MSATVKDSHTATADCGVPGMLTNIPFVVPAAIAFDAAGPAHLDHRNGIVLAGEQFRPGFTTELELGHEKPVVEAIHFHISVVAEPIKG